MAVRQLGRAGTLPDAAARLVDIATSRHPGYVSGRWYLPVGPGDTSTTGISNAAGSYRLVPFYVKSALLISTLAVNVTTASLTGHFALGIYAHGTGGPTGTPLATTATTLASTSGTLATAGVVTATLTTPVTLQPGWYWMAYVQDSTGPACAAYALTPMAGSRLIGNTTPANVFSNSVGALTYGGTYGTWPNFTSVTPIAALANSVPVVLFQAGTTG